MAFAPPPKETVVNAIPRAECGDSMANASTDATVEAETAGGRVQERRENLAGSGIGLDAVPLSAQCPPTSERLRAHRVSERRQDLSRRETGPVSRMMRKRAPEY